VNETPAEDAPAEETEAAAADVAEAAEAAATAEPEADIEAEAVSEAEVEAEVEAGVEVTASDTRDVAQSAGAPADSGSVDADSVAPVGDSGSVTAADGGGPPPIVVACPQCAVPADPKDLCCPSCHEDLAALVRLRYAGRIAFNDALGQLRAGRREAAAALLQRAVAAEPGLVAAERLLARLSPAAPAPAQSR
jgi:hypothetical protein